MRIDDIVMAIHTESTRILLHPREGKKMLTQGRRILVLSQSPFRETCSRSLDFDKNLEFSFFN